MQIILTCLPCIQSCSHNMVHSGVCEIFFCVSPNSVTKQGLFSKMHYLYCDSSRVFCFNTKSLGHLNVLSKSFSLSRIKHLFQGMRQLLCEWKRKWSKESDKKANSLSALRSKGRHTRRCFLFHNSSCSGQTPAIIRYVFVSKNQLSDRAQVEKKKSFASLPMPSLCLALPSH